jgi:hypothetical protein
VSRSRCCCRSCFYQAACLAKNRPPIVSLFFRGQCFVTTSLMASNAPSHHQYRAEASIDDDPIHSCESAEMTKRDSFQSTAPHRVQLRRTKGWRMPANTVKVDRSSRWGNPFAIGEISPSEDYLGRGTPAELCGLRVRDRAHAIESFRKWLFSPSEKAAAWRAASSELRGKDLACWCPLEGPCHADIMLTMANRQTSNARNVKRPYIEAISIAVTATAAVSPPKGVPPSPVEMSFGPRPRGPG